MRYAELAKLFEERVEGIEFYKNLEVLKTAEALGQTLRFHTKQILFLIGEPGVGKSAFLRHLGELLDGEYPLYFFETPFFEPVDFIKTLLKKGGKEPSEYALERLIAEAKELFAQKDAIVVIDEAQLLTKEMVELLRILADSKAFWFLLAMHKHESQKILSQPQFASRPHKVFELQPMSKEECRRFILTSLAKVNETDIGELLARRYLGFIYRLSRGNFRELKKLLFNLFLILDEASRLGERRFDKISRCTLTMAAIESGLLHV